MRQDIESGLSMERPIRVLFATCEPLLAEGVRVVLNHLTKRPVMMIEFRDIAALRRNARQQPCDLVCIWCNGVVVDSQRPAGTHWRDYTKSVEQLRREFPTTPILCVSSHYDPDFPARVAQVGAGLLSTPFELKDLMDYVPPELFNRV